jgi:hypothetical protein
MNLELDPEEERALVAELRRIIRDDRYPLSRRIIRTLQAILDKLDRDGTALRRRAQHPGLAQAARLLGLRQPQDRFRRHRGQALITATTFATTAPCPVRSAA